jgi:hypothetical protein
MPTSTFWTAFYAGLAAPVSLFAATPSYDAYTVVLTPAQAYAIAGSYLSQSVAIAGANDRRPSNDATVA